MANARTLKAVGKIRDFYSEVTESLHTLYTAIEDQNEEEIESAVEGLPGSTAITNQAEKLAELIDAEPWISKKKGKKDA